MPPRGRSQVLPALAAVTSRSDTKSPPGARVTAGIVSSGWREPGTVMATPIATRATTDAPSWPCWSCPDGVAGVGGGLAGSPTTPARYWPLAAPAGTDTVNVTSTRDPGGTLTVWGRPCNQQLAATHGWPAPRAT